MCYSIHCKLSRGRPKTELTRLQSREGWRGTDVVTLGPTTTVRHCPYLPPRLAANSYLIKRGNLSGTGDSGHRADPKAGSVLLPDQGNTARIINNNPFKGIPGEAKDRWGRGNIAASALHYLCGFVQPYLIWTYVHRGRLAACNILKGPVDLPDNFLTGILGKGQAAFCFGEFFSDEREY